MSSLASALRVLSLLQSESPVLRVSDAARALGLPKSTVSRVCKALDQAGLMERDSPGQGFRAGPHLFRLGNLYRARVPAEERIDAALARMVRTFPATAYVGVLRGLDLVVLRRHEGFHPVRFIQEPGSVIPAFATAVGRALLARLPEAALAAMPRRLTAAARGADITRAALFRELAATRARGFALYDDPLLGVAAAGVAVRLAPGRELGFALCVAREAFDTGMRRAMATALCDAARAVGEVCGDPAWAAARPPGQ